MASSMAERLDGLLVFGQLVDTLGRPIAGHPRVGAAPAAQRGHDEGTSSGAPGQGRGSGGNGDGDRGPGPGSELRRFPPDQPVRLGLLDWEPLATYTPDRHFGEPVLSGQRCHWRA